MEIICVGVNFETVCNERTIDQFVMGNDRVFDNEVNGFTESVFEAVVVFVVFHLEY